MEIKVIVWCSASFHFELEASTDIRPSNFIATFRSLKFNTLFFAHNMYHSSLLVRRHPIFDQLWLGHVGVLTYLLTFLVSQRGGSYELEIMAVKVVYDINDSGKLLNLK
jgi:hypothetical protein